MNNYQEILNTIGEEIRPLQGLGKQASYIPMLAQVDPNQFGIHMVTAAGQNYSLGDSNTKFSIQSISKVFALCMALSREGDALWNRVGIEPSGSAFNSVVLLELEHGKPRNPFINAGAIVLADVLHSHLKYPEEQFLHFVRQLCGDNTIAYNRELARSERHTGYRNAAIAYLLKEHGNLHGDIEAVLRFYCLMCSVEMSCKQLANAFLRFAIHRTRGFKFDGVYLNTSQVKRINAIMQTCGFYDEAGEFSFLVGLPGKSGVGGGIAAINPGKWAVTVWSPRLNDKGNSIMGMKALELLTTYTKESIF